MPLGGSGRNVSHFRAYPAGRGRVRAVWRPIMQGRNVWIAGAVLAALAVAVFLPRLFGGGSSPESPTVSAVTRSVGPGSTTPSAEPTGAGSSSGPVLLAAGDIACDPANPAFNDGRGTATLCRQGDVAKMMQRLRPDVVMALGDTLYGGASLAGYRASYEPSWGRFLDETRAVVGNHEYETPSAQGYFDYFGDRAGPQGRGYYSFDEGAWHVVVLNSNCWEVSCAPSDAQVRWLVKDLRRNRSACLLAAWHHPRWSSGLHGGYEPVSAFLRPLASAGVDVILNGHDHHYERFAPRTADGRADPDGFRQFIVGTGGAEIYPIGVPAALSEERRAAFGVLELTLGEGGYDWSFESLEGPGDRGSASCGVPG